MLLLNASLTHFNIFLFHRIDWDKKIKDTFLTNFCLLLHYFISIVYSCSIKLMWMFRPRDMHWLNMKSLKKQRMLYPQWMEQNFLHRLSMLIGPLAMDPVLEPSKEKIWGFFLLICFWILIDLLNISIISGEKVIFHSTWLISS